MGFDPFVAFLRSLAFIPGLERDKEECTVGGVDAAQQAVSDDGADILHAGRVHHDLLDVARRIRRALQRRRVRQLQAAVEVSLVFIGEKASRELFTEVTCTHGEHAEQEKREDGLVDQVSAYVHVAVGGTPEDPVEPAEEGTERSSRLLSWDAAA